ncbi:MAG: endolytic transglycosylase MltG [Deltaproteobacteria bacterium]|nr:MAG: endolytic transglycosylase MltG [Deltaproteobacteria bacterium]
MNPKAQQWVKLSQWLRQRHQQVRRAGQMGASIPAAKLPEFSDPELQTYVKENGVADADAASLNKLHIATAYQAILQAPASEAEVMKTLGFSTDKSRQDALYAHAAEYTRWVEDEAGRESDLLQGAGRRGRWLQVVGLAFMLILLGAGTWGYFTYKSWQRYLDNPAGAQKGMVKLTIPRGASTETVADLLQETGVLSEKTKFYVLVRYHHYLKNFFPDLQRLGRIRLRAGTYKISTSLTPQQILAVLRKGPKRESIRVTIPEGFNIFKIAARLEKKGICREVDFLRLALNADYSQKVLGWEAPRLEGYLYPDTYRFYKNTPPAQVISKMVKRFKSVFTPTFKRRAAALNWTVHQAVTMASIVEKETGQARERPKISSVFHNRLRRKWKLETDPTVIYGLLPNFNGNITQKDLHNPHPYNTYKHRGLPPGPIASPGQAALRAALYPLKTRYMFFVSKNDGTHIFSRTGREHRKWVEVYQKKK